MKDIKSITKLAALLLSLVFLLSPSETFSWIFFILTMVTVGIPHGAVDHLVSGSTINNKSLFIFLLKYSGIIFFYALLWYLLPVFSLIFFFLISFFHFGEAHFIGQKLLYKYFTYFSFGAYWLTLMLFSSFSESEAILKSVVDIGFLAPFQFLIPASFAVLSVVFIMAEPIKNKAFFFVEHFILTLFIFHLPLLFSFALYFAFWHALPTMYAEYNFMKNQNLATNIIGFIKKLAPLSLISFAGITVILLISNSLLETNELVLLFFVLISVITAPHVFVMHNFLERENKIKKATF